MAYIDFPTSPVEGQIYTFGGRTWQYNGKAWQLHTLQTAGPQGYTGSRGETGYVGSASIAPGPRGYTGSQGAGFTGSQGDLGYTGSQGELGYTGSQGAGFTGSAGYVGSRGVQGPIGYTGSRGEAGYVGADGYTGSRGYTGSASTVAGPTGYTGSIGYTGSQGAGFTGSQGATGFTGSQGSLGYTGSQGAGFTGSQGDLGYTGSQGELGYTGSQGAGFTGSQGDVGYTGSAGANGYAGSQGAIGYTGSAGSALGVSTVVGTDVGTVADVYTDVTSLRFDAVGFNVVQLSDGSIKIEQGETGGSSAASVSIGISPPATSTPGDMWWNSETGTLKIYYGDADSAQWVDATPSGAVITPQPLYALFAASATTITPGTDSVIQFNTLTEGSSTFFNGTDIVIPETGIYEISFRGMAAYTALNDNALEWAGRIKISTDNGSTWTSIVYNRVAKDIIGYGGISFGAHLTAKLLTAGTLVRATINLYDRDNNAARTLDLTEDTHNITLFKKG